MVNLFSRTRVEYQPAKDGFVFSIHEIHAAIDREQRLNQASTIIFPRLKPRKSQSPDVENITVARDSSHPEIHLGISA